MYTLLKVSEEQVNKGIYHVRENGDFVEELFKKDADLFYEVTEKNDYFGNKYAFFIIEVESGDQIKCPGEEFSIETVPRFKERTIYWQSCEINEMCYQLLNQNKPLPQKIEYLLKDKLSIFFMRPIIWATRGYNSKSVWDNYKGILEHLDKNANEFVPQEKIDYFILSLIKSYELSQVESMSKSKYINISSKNIEEYLKAEERMKDTIIIAKELISKKGYRDIEYRYAGVQRVSISADDTPCGNIKIEIMLIHNEIFVWVHVSTYNGCLESDSIDISKECQEFAKNFIEK